MTEKWMEKRNPDTSQGSSHGDPSGAQRSGSVWERRSDEVGETSQKREDERYEVRDDAMKVFEKITQTPETLAEMLAGLSLPDSPWDRAFREKYCAACSQVDCDDCPYEAYRGNPLWWLGLEVGNAAEQSVQESGIVIPEGMQHIESAEGGCTMIGGDCTIQTGVIHTDMSEKD